jgi:biotin transport system substrate-specific component
MQESNSINPALLPGILKDRAIYWHATAILLGVAFLALASRVEVPTHPVPITMQTYAVGLVGALFGWRMGFVVILAWLAGAALGLPLLAGGGGGPAAFWGPTAGYLFAFPVMAAVIGWLVERGWDGRKPVLAFFAFLVGGTLCLFIGAAWLGHLIGMAKAIEKGLMPFLLGDVLKSALGAASLGAIAIADRRLRNK